MIFYHHGCNIFLSTPSARRATPECRRRQCPHRHFYPRPPRGGRQFAPKCKPAEQYISIHALREEGDGQGLPLYSHLGHFYPRPPRGGRLCLAVLVQHGLEKFLSTPSARRATRSIQNKSSQKVVFLSTPSARRATDLSHHCPPCSKYFYPRPPRGGRPPSNMSMLLANKFLSTPSARRATLSHLL